MLIKGIVDEDFVNYKKPSMLLLMPHCNWKCGGHLCHNSPLATAPEIEVDPDKMVERYINNPISEALVFSGLEPFMDLSDVKTMMRSFRKVSDNVIVIYTGYNKEEVAKQVEDLKNEFSNLIIKFGRYQPGQMSHIDPILGIALASDNQYAEKVS